VRNVDAVTFSREETAPTPQVKSDPASGSPEGAATGGETEASSWECGGFATDPASLRRRTVMASV
jgi:hypothetical protein